MSSIKETIRKEIERLKELNEGLYTEGDNSYYEGQDNGYNHILSFIDSLPEEASCIYDTNKFTPTPSVNIEEVARVQFASHAHVFDRKRKAVFDWEQFKEVAGIFYGFGKRDSLPDETCKDSLQVQETCKENQDSFTDEPKELEEAADQFQANHSQLYEVTSYPIEVVKELERNAYLAGAKWQKKQDKDWLNCELMKAHLSGVKAGDMIARTEMRIQKEKPSNDLEKAAGRLGFDYVDNIVHESPEHRWNDHDVEFGYRDGFIAGAKWMESQMPMPEDTVIFMKGVAEGRRLEREDRNNDNLPRYYGD